MNERSYIGIDNINNDEWIAVLWSQGKIAFSRPFKNTSSELEALVKFITALGSKPKICINPTHPASLKLIKFIGGIPDAEVMLISNAGIKLYLDWSGEHQPACFQSHSRRAFQLACCAKRVI